MVRITATPFPLFFCWMIRRMMLLFLLLLMWYTVDLFHGGGVGGCVNTKCNVQTYHGTHSSEDVQRRWRRQRDYLTCLTTASGLLGAQNQIDPLAVLGIKTLGRYNSESVATYDYGDIGMTPRSEATKQMPLRITSMRKPLPWWHESLYRIFS